jgi:hypothetical protein
MRAKTINEMQNFNRGTDAKQTLGIGMMGQIKMLAREQEKDFIKRGFFLFVVQPRDILYESGIKIIADDMVSLTQYFEDSTGKRYELNLKGKIYIDQ